MLKNRNNFMNKTKKNNVQMEKVKMLHSTDKMDLIKVPFKVSENQMSKNLGILKLFQPKHTH